MLILIFDNVCNNKKNQSFICNCFKENGDKFHAFIKYYFDLFVWQKVILPKFLAL